MSTTTKTVISQESFDTLTAAVKSAHHVLVNHMVATKQDTSDIPSDFSKCGLKSYGLILRKCTDLMSEKVAADKEARLAHFRTSIAKASETYITAAQTAWSQASALPAEVRETLGIKAPVSVNVPVSAFSAAWTDKARMGRDLIDMGYEVVKSDKGDYIKVAMPKPAAPVAKAA